MNVEEKAKQCLLNIPITVNGSFGDAFTPAQWENTLSKLRYLKAQHHQGEVHVSSKYVLTDSQLDELQSIFPDMWIYCGITGLNESTVVSDEERYDHYLRVCKRFPKTVISIRPVIPGKNDSLESVNKLIELAKRGRGLMQQGGFKNIEDIRGLREDDHCFEHIVEEMCKKKGVIITSKCSCMQHLVVGTNCSIHTDKEPENLDVLAAFGFDFDVTDGIVVVKGFRGSGKITKGDVNFCNHIIQSNRIKREWDHPKQKMQVLGPNGQHIVVTSSFYNWSRQMDSCLINCFYCMARPGAQTSLTAGDFGCSPLDLAEVLLAR